MKKIIKEIKSNEELTALLGEGVELNIYSNDERLLINTRVPLEIDKIDFRGTSIIDKVDRIIKSCSNLEFLIGEPLSSFNKYYSYQVVYGIK